MITVNVTTTETSNVPKVDKGSRRADESNEDRGESSKIDESINTQAGLADSQSLGDKPVFPPSLDEITSSPSPSPSPSSSPRIRLPPASDHYRYTRFFSTASPLYRHASRSLVVIGYVQLLLEMMVRKRKGDKGRWGLVVGLELIK